MSEPDQFKHDLAQKLRESHCDRQGAAHKCVGEMTVRKGQISLNCALCGSGHETPGWSVFIANKLDIIFHAAGIKFENLSRDAQVAAIAAYGKVSDN